MLKNNPIHNACEDKATFILHVQHRENATWQGNITWADKNKSCNFRSALELLKLIDGALDTTIIEEGQEAGASKGDSL